MFDNDRGRQTPPRQSPGPRAPPWHLEADDSSYKNAPLHRRKCRFTCSSVFLFLVNLLERSVLVWSSSGDGREACPCVPARLILSRVDRVVSTQNGGLEQARVHAQTEARREKWEGGSAAVGWQWRLGASFEFKGSGAWFWVNSCFPITKKLYFF